MRVAAADGRTRHTSLCATQGLPALLHHPLMSVSTSARAGRAQASRRARAAARTGRMALADHRLLLGRPFLRRRSKRGRGRATATPFGACLRPLAPKSTSRQRRVAPPLTRSEPQHPAGLQAAPPGARSDTNHGPCPRHFMCLHADDAIANRHAHHTRGPPPHTHLVSPTPTRNPQHTLALQQQCKSGGHLTAAVSTRVTPASSSLWQRCGRWRGGGHEDLERDVARRQLALDAVDVALVAAVVDGGDKAVQLRNKR